MRILIADDEAMIREWIVYSVSKLEDVQIDIDEASDGVEAYEKVSNNTYDLLLLDIQMPKMTGLELIKKIGAISYQPMVVILSSHDQFDYARTAFQFGADEYILKNEFSSDQLQALIWKCEKYQHDRKIQINIGYYRSEFLNTILVGSTESGSLPKIELLFPEIDGQNFLVITCTRSLLLKDMQNQFKISDGVSIFQDLVYIGNSNDAEYFILSYDKEKKDLDIDHVLRHYAEHNEIRMGCSQPLDDIKQIAHGILTSRKAWAKLFYRNTSFALAEPETDLHDSEKVFEEVIEITAAIKSKDLDFARDQLTLLMDEILRTEPDQIGRIKEAFYTIISEWIVHLSSDSANLMPNLSKIKFEMDHSTHFSSIQALVTKYFFFFDSVQIELPRQLSPYVFDAIKFIENHYADITSIATIANHVHLNTDYLSRLFKKETGTTISSFLINYKLDVAANLLRSSRQTVAEIARAVGYENISYFSKNFKDKFNLKPNQYRKKNQN